MEKPAEMSMERAREINTACVVHHMWELGIREEPPPDLSGYTLPELLQARDMVRDADDAQAATPEGCRTMDIFCGDRLLAALYALYHYDPQDPKACEPVISAPGRAACLF